MATRRRPSVRVALIAALAGLLGALLPPSVATPAGVVAEFPANGLPENVAAGPDGNLWFAEYGANKIGRVTVQGVVTEFTAPLGSSPSAVAAGADGNLWFTEVTATKIGRLSPPPSTGVKVFLPKVPRLATGLP